MVVGGENSSMLVDPDNGIRSRDCYHVDHGVGLSDLGTRSMKMLVVILIW